jgi:hypothetical protein
MIRSTRDRWDRPRLAIAGTSVADVVDHAGGLIFDKAMAGWNTIVLIPDIADARPLQILGTAPLDLESALARSDESVRRLDWPPFDAVIASGSLLASDRRVRTTIADVLGRGSPRVVLWGLWDPHTIDVRFEQVEYGLSHAARVFKAQALMAAGLSASDGGCRAEVFMSSAARVAAL